MNRFPSACMAALLSVGALTTPAATQAQIAVGVGIGVAIPPPPLPVYVQPPMPGDGYMWTPGYWAWDGGVSDYYWVPGDWVLPPAVGLLWTPPWWGWSNGVYAFNAGYWGPSVGFYGGINYGFGYGGFGYDGGYWRGRNFWYNRAVNNLGAARARFVFARPVGARTPLSRVSFNGGRGGLRVRPTPAQLGAARQKRVDLTNAQLKDRQAARANPARFAGKNHGAPAMAMHDHPGRSQVAQSRAGHAPSAGHNPTTAHHSSYSRRHTYGHSYSHAQGHAYGHTRHPYGHAYGHTSHPYGHANGHTSHPYGHAYGHAYGQSYGHGYGHAYSPPRTEAPRQSFGSHGFGGFPRGGFAPQGHIGGPRHGGPAPHGGGDRPHR